MIPADGTIHFVNGKQVCEKQYSDCKERLGYERGYYHGKQEGRKEVVEWIRDVSEPSEADINATGYIGISQDIWQAKLKEWEVRE